jgi:hypothetical protein
VSRWFCFSSARDFVFEPGRLCRHPSIRTLCRAMVRSVQVGRSRFSRCCYLIIELSSLRGVGPGLGRSHLNSAVELGSWHATPRPRRLPLGGCCAVVHKLLRSPITCAAVRPTSVPRQRRLVSWRSCRPVRRASVPSAVDRCPVQTAPECTALLAPAAFADNGLLLC